MVPVCKLVEKLDLDQMLLLQTCEVGTTGTIFPPKLTDCDGWMTMFRYTKQVNDYSALALTKLDILDKLEEIRIGVEYVKDGKRLDYYPSSEFQFRGVEVSRKQKYFLYSFSTFFWLKSVHICEENSDLCCLQFCFLIVYGTGIL